MRKILISVVSIASMTASTIGFVWSTQEPHRILASAGEDVGGRLIPALICLRGRGLEARVQRVYALSVWEAEVFQGLSASGHRSREEWAEVSLERLASVFPRLSHEMRTWLSEHPLEIGDYTSPPRDTGFESSYLPRRCHQAVISATNARPTESTHWTFGARGAPHDLNHILPVRREVWVYMDALNQAAVMMETALRGVVDLRNEELPGDTVRYLVGRLLSDADASELSHRTPLSEFEARLARD